MRLQIQWKKEIICFDVEKQISALPIVFYSVFHWFGQTKFVNIVSILNPSQISLPPQLRQKTKLMSKVVKTDTKIIISLPKI
jgi:hypothetical protein